MNKWIAKLIASATEQMMKQKDERYLSICCLLCCFSLSDEWMFAVSKSVGSESVRIACEHDAIFFQLLHASFETPMFLFSALSIIIVYPMVACYFILHCHNGLICIKAAAAYLQY